MKRFVSHTVLLSILLVGISVLVGCGTSTEIGDIVANPSEYEDKEIDIKGTVGETNWFPLLGKGTYQVGDGTGNIWVVTSQPPPQEGEEVALKGTVKIAFKLGESNFGTVLVEESRD